jgi:hypothetical protein
MIYILPFLLLDNHFADFANIMNIADFDNYNIADNSCYIRLENIAYCKGMVEIFVAIDIDQETE